MMMMICMIDDRCVLSRLQTLDEIDQLEQKMVAVVYDLVYSIEPYIRTCTLHKIRASYA